MPEPVTVHVPLGERAYDILIGPDLIETAGERLKAMFPARRFGIVTDSEVAKVQLPRLTRSLHSRRWYPRPTLPKLDSLVSQTRAVSAL